MIYWLTLVNHVLFLTSLTSSIGTWERGVILQSGFQGEGHQNRGALVILIKHYFLV